MRSCLLTSAYVSTGLDFLFEREETWCCPVHDFGRAKAKITLQPDYGRLVRWWQRCRAGDRRHCDSQERHAFGGVASQYASALGKIANCQTLVSLTWARGTPQSCWRCGCFFPRVGRASGLDWIERMGPAEYGMARTKPEIALVEIDRGGQAGASPSAARRHSIDSGRRHQHSAGAQKDGEDQAIGRSKGGLSTKIHLMVDALDNPLACFLTGGQAHDLLATQEKPGADRTGACTRLARSRLLSLTGNSSPPVSYQAFAAVANVSPSQFSTVGEREHPAEGVAPMITSRHCASFSSRA